MALLVLCGFAPLSLGRLCSRQSGRFGTLVHRVHRAKVLLLRVGGRDGYRRKRRRAAQKRLFVTVVTAQVVTVGTAQVRAPH